MRARANPPDKESLLTAPCLLLPTGLSCGGSAKGLRVDAVGIEVDKEEAYAGIYGGTKRLP